MACIYKITNIVTNQSYIGQTIRSLEDRWRDHVRDAKTSKRPLHLAITEYGECSFIKEIICSCSEEELDSLERHYIDLYNSRLSGYNCTVGGQSRKSYKDSYIEHMYLMHDSAAETARQLGVNVVTVTRALDRLGYSNLIKKRVRLVAFDKDFDSIADAAQWLISNKYTDGSYKSVQNSVSRALSGLRKTYLGSEIRPV